VSPAPPLALAQPAGAAEGPSSVAAGKGLASAAAGFDYSLLIGGASSTLTPSVSLQLEERRSDIDTSHGNLPKRGVALRVTPRLLASLSYAQPVGGNLGTKLGTVRADDGGDHFTALAGAPYGAVAPSIRHLLPAGAAAGRDPA
jgi:hypothetical protein